MLTQLLPHMPADQRNETALLNTLRSPDYRVTFNTIVNQSPSIDTSVAGGISNLSIETARSTATGTGINSREDKVRVMILALKQTFPPDSDSSSRMDES